MSEAEDRARSAWDARFKHVKAANTWRAVAHESPARREVSEILANWMTAYADADADAEMAFDELAVREALVEPWGVWCTPATGNSVGCQSWLTDSSDRGTPRRMTPGEARAFASSANLVSTAWTYEARAM